MLEATITTAEHPILSMEKRKKLNGTFRGVYEYDPSEIIRNIPPVAFTLILKQHWLGFFSGTVTDDPPFGIPGSGSVNGDFSYPLIRFTKRMPVSYLLKPDGQWITFREWVTQKGYPCENDFPGPDILYHGKFSDLNRAQGTWTIAPRFVRLPKSKKLGFKLPGMNGSWSIAFEHS